MATMQTNVINNIPEVLNHTLFPITLVSITILFLVYHESTNQWINNLIGYEGDSKTTPINTPYMERGRRAEQKGGRG